MQNSIGDRLRDERELQGLKKTELASRVSMTSAGIGQIESGTTKSPTPENLYKIADALGLNARWLTSGKGERYVTRRSERPSFKGLRFDPSIDMDQLTPESGLILYRLRWEELDSLATVTTSYQSNHKGKYMRPAGASDSSFILEVVDDSMRSPQGRSYHSGMLLVVDPEQTTSVKAGDRVIARPLGQRAAVFREIITNGDELALRALNPHYPPIFGPFDVLGKVLVGIQE